LFTLNSRMNAIRPPVTKQLAARLTFVSLLRTVWLVILFNVYAYGRIVRYITRVQLQALAVDNDAGESSETMSQAVQRLTM
jgi:hypothetical protein